MNFGYKSKCPKNFVINMCIFWLENRWKKFFFLNFLVVYFSQKNFLFLTIYNQNVQNQILRNFQNEMKNEEIRGKSKTKLF